LTSIAAILEEIRGLGFKGKKAAAFGSYGWSGESVKMISENLKVAGFEIVNEGIMELWNPNDESIGNCIEYGKNIAQAFN
ncbi:MAG: anaerobic nitric oxide reductase flavorubredoxin, partial [Thermoplasmata archaeon]|nr:anaerobic nitric oxide reductase flavorubredoxin [Thermoplasmata archaeon]